MKIFKELILKKNIKKLGKGVLKVVDNIALGGAITKTTQETEGSPSGSIPIIEILSSLVPVILLIAVLAGWIDVSELKELLKLF
jgi:hypothetical protein